MQYKLVLSILLACCLESKTYNLCMITQLVCSDVLCFVPFWAEVHGAHTDRHAHRANSMVLDKKQHCIGQEAALYWKSKKQQSAEANRFVGDKKQQQNITCGAPHFQPAWCQNLGGA
jgi:hypothetical protein